MSAWNPLEALGSALIAAGLAAIGWVMTTFTKRHIDSMDKLGDRLDKLGDQVGLMGQDVSEMRANIGAIRDSNDRLDARVTKLEDREHQR